MIVPALSTPWSAPLSMGEHRLILFCLAFAGLALFAGFIRTWLTRDEVGPRYRTSTVARMGIMGVSALTYLGLIVAFFAGYAYDGGQWIPNEFAVDTFSGRYVGWAVTVPLLCVELIAVCTVSGVNVIRTRFVAVGSTLGMIFAGFLGAVVVNDGGDASSYVILGLVSCAFWMVANVVLVRAVRKTLVGLTPAATQLLIRGTVVLLVGWVIYPFTYVIPLFVSGGEWTTTIHVILCAADVLVKLTFAGLIHRVAKHRTAEDVRNGIDVHPESIWMSSERLSEARPPQLPGGDWRQR